MSIDTDDAPLASGNSYAEEVGERLRAIRRQKGMSLQEVEAASEQEFKASVLGAYERGERAISLPRFQRLARFYNVPVDQLLPRDEGKPFARSGEAIVDGTVDLVERRGRTRDGRIVIDLTKLEALGGPESKMLSRYLAMIQVQRQDFNGRVLTVRRDDLRAIACILDTSVESAHTKLEDMGLKPTPGMPMPGAPTTPFDPS